MLFLKHFKIRKEVRKMRTSLADQVRLKGERVKTLAQQIGRQSRLEVVTVGHTKSWDKGWGQYGKA